MTAAGFTVINTANASIANGLANFAGTNVGISGLVTNSATLTFTMTLANSQTISVNQTGLQLKAGLPTKLAIETQPGAVAAGGTFSSDVKVSVRDAYDNIVLVDTSSVTASLVSAANTSVVIDTKTPVAVTSNTGIVTFTGLSFNRAGTYKIHFEDGALTAADSVSFTISAAADDESMNHRPGPVGASPLSITPSTMHFLPIFWMLPSAFSSMVVRPPAILPLVGCESDRSLVLWRLITSW